MIDLNNRYKCIVDVVNEHLNAIFQDCLQPTLSLTGTHLDHLRANCKTIEEAQKEYNDNIYKWKKHFSIPDRLDRHKVAAVTAHYLIKHIPIVTIVNRPELNNVGLLSIINELATLHVAISRLKNNGVPYNLESSLMGSYIQTFKKHSNVSDKFENYAIFVECLARDFYQLEKDYLEKVKKPS